jgi:phosphoglycerate kinase
MRYNKKSVSDVDVARHKILVRVDFNVPLQNGAVSDDTRIRASLPTLEYLANREASLILCSHLGRPKGERREDLSLKPAALRLAELFDRDVLFVGDCVGPEVTEVASGMKPGEVLLLENTRFHPEEKANNEEFAKQLASLAEIFVNDAFGSAHRAHASTTGVAAFLPAVAGFLMERELKVLGMVMENPDHPFIGILGGAKISDKIGVVKSLLEKADYVLLGGGMANTFLAAQGYTMGDSLVEHDSVEVAADFLRQSSGKLHLPVDLVIADSFANDADRKVVGVNEVPDGWQSLDIGPETIRAFSNTLEDAKLVVWNGPMGVFEFEAFAKGTYELAAFIAASGAKAIIGGGDSAAAIKQAGLEDRIYHISTGGGASLALLAGESLPGVEALDDR